MTSAHGDGFGFASTDDVPIPYMQRIRDYYLALGYGAPYRWAHYTAVPFQPLQKPLEQCRVAIVTTAAPYQPGKGDQGPSAPYNAAAKFYTVYSGDTSQDHDLRISHVAIDRMHTTAEDVRHLLSASGNAPRGRARSDRVCSTAFSRAANQSQPSNHS